VKRLGRKPKYRKQDPRIAKAMCKCGATDYELAQKFEVSTSTIWRWYSNILNFAMLVERASYDERVERGLAQRVRCYS
jgi:hypothetical protein